MAQKHIDLHEGDTLTVRVVPKVVAPVEPDPDSNEVLLKIEPVTIYHQDHGAYVNFRSDLDICNDGSGPAHGDQHHQSQTAYCSGGKDGGKYLNADKDKYMVVPPQIRAMVPGVVMGCQGRATNLQTGVSSDAVVGDIGPDDKTGECAYCLAKVLNSNVGHNEGDKGRNYFYELWPDVAAVVDGHTYKLQPS